MEDSRRRGRRMLLIVAAMFLLPVVVAFALYYGKLWRPAGSASKGELITPARPLDVAGLRMPDGTPAGEAVFAGKWSLIYIGDGACDADCRQALVFARQSRLALNNEMTRVQRVFLATGNCCDDRVSSRRSIPGSSRSMLVARGAGAAGAVSRRTARTRCSSSIRSAIS